MLNVRMFVVIRKNLESKDAFVSFSFLILSQIKKIVLFLQTNYCRIKTQWLRLIAKSLFKYIRMEHCRQRHF